MDETNERMDDHVDLPQKCLLQVREAAALLNCSQRTIYRLIQSGDLQALKIRNCLRIPKKSISEYVSQQIVEYQIRNG